MLSKTGPYSEECYFVLGFDIYLTNENKDVSHLK